MREPKICLIMIAETKTGFFRKNEVDMRYEHTVKGRFLERPNRFIAYVEVNGQRVICHVINTGRCRELLTSGCTVVLEFHPHAREMGRKTEFDLIAVYKGNLLINMDSQAPNRAALEWMENLSQKEPNDNALRMLQPFDPSGSIWLPRKIRREAVHKDSRFDLAFMLENQQTGALKPAFMEVKGVTLEENGIVRFPDAPTERGVKHLQGLSEAVSEGFEAFVLFVIQMEGVREFRPNDETHKAFGDALRAGARAGLHILAYDCEVKEASMKIRREVKISLS